MAVTPLNIYVSLLVSGVLVCLYLLVLARQWRRHQRNLQRIPLRIHVNGTRGKSSVTRLIAAGLRAGGLRVIAKTTGTTPRLILEDGVEYPILRAQGSNIREQVYALDFAAQREAEVIVFECMAVNPEYQWVCEHRILQSQIGVITNVRLDHSDVMGGSLWQIASCLSNTVPRQGTLITSEVEQLLTLQARAERLHTAVYAPDPARVSDRELAGFPYPVFRENVALALAVCQLLEVDRDTALTGMYAALPDPGTLAIFTRERAGKRITVANALAANDVMSTRQIWDRVTVNTSYTQRILLYCSRRDRPARDAEFTAAFCARWPIDLLLLVGDGAGTIRRQLDLHSPHIGRIVSLEHQSEELITKEVLTFAPDRSVILLAGNIVGLGERLVHSLQELDAHEPVCVNTVHRPADLVATV